jgi:hypothetical protein
MSNFWLDKFKTLPQGEVFVSVSGSTMWLVEHDNCVLKFRSQEDEDSGFAGFWQTFTLLWQSETEMCFHLPDGPHYFWAHIKHISYSYQGNGPHQPATLGLDVEFIVRD